MKFNMDKMSWWAKVLSFPFLFPVLMPILLACIILVPMIVPVALIAVLDGKKAFEE